MSITCPRCSEQIDGVPDGCRDPSCPRQEIEALEREQYAEIMAAGKAESDTNVAYGAAKDAVIAAARALEKARDDWRAGCPEPLGPKYERLRATIAALDKLEKKP